jgi:hypothetical protein
MEGENFHHEGIGWKCQDSFAWLRLKTSYELLWDHLCGLVVILPGCRPRGLEFDSRRCQTF